MRLRDYYFQIAFSTGYLLIINLWYLEILIGDLSPNRGRLVLEFPNRRVSTHGLRAQEPRVLSLGKKKKTQKNIKKHPTIDSVKGSKLTCSKHESHELLNICETRVRLHPLNEILVTPIQKYGDEKKIKNYVLFMTLDEYSSPPYVHTSIRTSIRIYIRIYISCMDVS